MHYRKGIGAVVFKKNPTRFLIFHRTKNWSGWELLKGGLKPDENELKALRRETKEETGLKTFKIIGKIGYKVKYKWPKNFVKDHHKFIGAENNYYLIEVFSEKIKIDKREHNKYRWVTKTQALKLLTYEDNKRALRKAVMKYGEIL